MSVADAVVTAITLHNLHGVALIQRSSHSLFSAMVATNPIKKLAESVQTAKQTMHITTHLIYLLTNTKDLIQKQKG